MRFLSSVVFVVLLVVLVLPAVARAQTTNLTTAGGQLFDFLPNGSLSRGTTGSSYRGCSVFGAGGGYVGGTPTVSADGRTLTFPAETILGLTVQRIAYVPATGGDYAVWANVVTNPGPTTATPFCGTSCIAASDPSTTISATSSGDLTYDTLDDWLVTNDGVGPRDALGFVSHGPGAPIAVFMQFASAGDIESYYFRPTIPPGGRAVFLNFVIQKASTDDAGAEAEAARLVTLPPDAVVSLGAYLPDVVNFRPFSPCAGSDGSACTGGGGAAGTCHTGECCSGCWDGATCRHDEVTACGTAGGACASCVDTEPCTTDACDAVTHTCVHLPLGSGSHCEDGLFCTVGDTCDAANHCAGGSSACDDRDPCTMDACTEAAGFPICGGHPAAPDGSGCGGGVCHAGACCTGCWDGAACQPGSSSTVCGIGGATCISCSDGNACTDELCSLGVCAPGGPSSTATPCDDGLFCTTGDHCNGGGGCLSGTTSACDDGTGCTIDACDEAARSCTHTPLGGATCDISGTCRSAGETAPGAPCLVCDPSRSTTGWSTDVGGPCGTPSCVGGVLTSAPTCDATTACVPSTMHTTCATGMCLDATTCLDTCAADSDCTRDFFCDPSGTCRRRFPPGISCDRDAECTTGHVCSVDHHCCDVACGTTCSSCVVPGHEGMCRIVPPETDPDGDCVGSVCGPGGTCRPPDAGVTADAGTDAGDVDAGTDTDGASADASMDEGATRASGGCCGVAGASSRGGGALVVLVALFVARSRRRR